MSNTDSTTEGVRSEGAVQARNVRSVVRRMAVRVTSGPFWQGVGALLLDGITKEVREAEVFSGVGFYARPPAGANAEGVLVYEDGAENPYMVGTRDESTRRKVFPKNAPLGQDETAAFNSSAVLHIKAGKVLAYLVGHIADAVGLAKTSELNNLRAFVAAQFSGPGHTHAVTGGATTTTVPVGSVPAVDYVGTTVLKGQ